MSNFNLNWKPDLGEAQAAMAKLLPYLPMPRISEQLDCCGISLPRICTDVNLPFQEQPYALMERMGPFVRRLLPEQWLPAYYGLKERYRRNAQLMSFHEPCKQYCEYVPEDVNRLDSIVAGVLLMSVKPLPGPLRVALTERAFQNWWGAYFAASGLVMADEAGRLLRCVSYEPRLVASLWQSNPDFINPLVPLAMGRNDLWSALLALREPLADLWLGRVCIRAESHGIPAVTALVLQPLAPPNFKSKWISRLKTEHPKLAYLAVRWSRFTWSQDWETLRDQLKANAISEGSTWFNWYRDIQPEPDAIDQALRSTVVDVLWQAELVALTKHHGQYLKTRMRNNHPDARESRLTLEWLQRRPRPC
jgi:hypothetical protein